MTARWIGFITAAAMLASGLAQAVVFPAEASAAQPNPTVTLNLASGQSYLGPEVVISGQAAAASGIETVTITVQDTTSGDYVQGTSGVLGATPVDLTAYTALLPPLGDPAVSWRVPLTLLEAEYEVVATATDASAATTTSTPTVFSVVAKADPPVTLVQAGAVWSYSDLGSEPATTGAPPSAWFEPDHDDGAWLIGPAELGYGDGDEATMTSALDAFDQPVNTTYFRHSFEFADPANHSTIDLSMLRDDGAVVYLNGQELLRSNMPPGPIAYGTFAASVSEQTVTLQLDPGDLIVGTNVLAVEVHQSSPTSSDISFALDLLAQPLIVPLVSDSHAGTYVLTAGDMARCNFDGDEAVAAQMAELFDTDAGVFIGLGDLAYNNGTIDEFTNCYEPTLGQFKDVTWPSPGNHEHYTAPNAAGYRSYFGAAAGPTAGPAGGLWYSFDIDDFWHVIALDSDCQGREILPGAVGGDGCARGSAQELWLRADLEANQDKNIIAFFHHPPYTNNQYTDHVFTWPLWQALAEYGADITLHGHEHHYERYTPLDYWGEPDSVFGIREFIIGSGGTFPRYDVRPQEPESDFRGTFPQGTNDFGVLQLWLRPDGYDWKWESIHGLAATDVGTSGLVSAMALANLTGTVDNADTNAPAVGIDVCATADRTGNETCTTSAVDGTWQIGPLVSDTYTVVAGDSETIFVTSTTAGVVISAPTDAELALSLELIPGAINGSVTAANTNAALSGIDVCVDSDVLASPLCEVTNASGFYEIGDLVTGTYQISYSDPGGSYLGECYLDTSCAAPTLVGVVAPGVRTNIDASLDPVPTPTPTPTPSPTATPDPTATPIPTVEPIPTVTPTPTPIVDPATITGTITVLSNGSAIFGAKVCAVRGLPPGQWCVFTNSSGAYTITDLTAANYSLIVSDPTRRFVDSCWGHSPCDTADVFGVTTLGAAIARDVALDPVYSSGVPTPTPTPVVGGDGSISGTIVMSSGASAAGIEVCAVSVYGGAAQCTTSDGAGAYTISSLPTSNYRVSFDNDSQCYRSRLGCDGFTPVGVVSPGTRTGIDATL